MLSSNDAWTPLKIQIPILVGRRRPQAWSPPKRPYTNMSLSSRGHLETFFLLKCFRTPENVLFTALSSFDPEDARV